MTHAGGYGAPSMLHPAFHGAFDWHSCVHMHWTLARLLRMCPSQAWETDAESVLASRLTKANIEAECAFLELPENHGFERSYGWAWVWKLHAELRLLATIHAEARTWANALEPLARMLSARYEQYLGRAGFPIRSGTHANTAFAMLFNLDWTASTGQASPVAAHARSWFQPDRDYPASYEPGAEDFLSPGLLQAVLMSRLLDAAEFRTWWDGFKPKAAYLQRWQEPVRHVDRSDSRLVHMDGLNLSRAWCWQELAPHLPATEAADARACAARHLASSLPHVTGGDYAGEHWLASFALLALTGTDGVGAKLNPRSAP